MSAPGSLRRELGVPTAVALAISTIIGSGLLGLPGLALAATSPVDTLAGWLVAIALSVPLMLVFMELTRTTGRAGGLATYVGMAFGAHARLATAVLLALTFALCIPLGTIMGSAYLAEIGGLSPSWTYPIAAIVIATTTIVNVLGVRSSSVVNMLSVAALVAFVVIIVVSNMEHMNVGLNLGADLLTGRVNPTSVWSLWTATAILFWAFLGWENLSFAGEDLKEKGGTVALVFVAAFFSVTILYVLLATVSVGAALNGTDVDRVSGLLALVGHSPFRHAIEALIVIVVIANVNAWAFAASRLYFGMAREGVFPMVFAKLNRFGAPANSLIVLGATYLVFIAAVGSAFLPLELGLMIANQSFAVTYLGAILCLLVHGRGVWRKGLAMVAFVSGAVFVSGFGLMLALPLSLLCAVAILSFIRAKTSAERASRAAAE